MTEYEVGDDYEPDPMAQRPQFYVPAQRDTMKMLMLNAIIAGALFNLMVFVACLTNGNRTAAMVAAASEGFAYLTAATQVSAPKHPAAPYLLICATSCGLGAFVGAFFHG